MNGMTLIVKTIVRFVSAAIMLYGAYLILYGEKTPGGGFAGGVIIATALVLIILAFGGKALEERISSIAQIMLSLGALSILFVGCWGMLSGGYFMSNFLPKSEHLAGTINLLDIGVGAAVAGGLFSVFVLLSGFELSKKERK